MVKIDFKDGYITVVFSAKEKTRWNTVLKKGDSQATIESEIRKALESSVSAWEHPDRKNEVAKASGNVKGWAAGIKSQLEGVKAPEKKEEKSPIKTQPAKAPEKPVVQAAKEEKAVRETAKRLEKERAQAAKAEKAAKAKDEKETARAQRQAEKEAHKMMPTKPQPVRDASFISKQFAELQKGEKRMNDAIDALHSNSGFIAKYLASRGDINRTEEQKTTTVAVFNALWQVPKFHFMLSALKDRMQEFGSLSEYMSSNKRLNASAENGIIVAADLYARYYLLVYSAQGNKGFREEVSQLPDTADRLKGIDQVVGYSNDHITQKTKDEVLKNKIFGAMDPDTVTAAALYIRRWDLEHPEVGEGKKQEEIKTWSAPEIIVPQEERKEAPKAEEKPKERTPLEKFADQRWKDLKGEIFSDATKGNVNALVTMMKDPGPDQHSIEAALTRLGRDDMDRATDRIFNEFFKSNGAFLDFCRGTKKYAEIAMKPAMILSETADKQNRRFYVKAMEEFINHSSTGKLGEDLKILYNSVLGMKQDKLEITGVSDMRLLSAIAVYTWRNANKDARVGAFAANIKGVTLPAETKADETAQPPKIRPRIMKLGGTE